MSDAVSKLIEAREHALIIAHEAWREFVEIMEELPPEEAAEIIAAALHELDQVLTEHNPQPASKRRGNYAHNLQEDRDGCVPFGELPTVAREIIGRIEGDFTIPRVLVEIRTKYPNTSRTTMHPLFKNFVTKGEIEIIKPGYRGGNKRGEPTVYRKADRK